MKQRFAGLFIWLFYRALRATWRVTYVEPSSLRPKTSSGPIGVLAHWHGDELALASTAGRYDAITIVSQSTDGEIMDIFFKLNGGHTTRGSSSRGGAGALKGLVTQVRKNRFNPSFAVDGPKGPIHEVKPGIFQFVRLVKEPCKIFAAGLACDRAWIFHKAWNKAYLPKPFAKLVIQWLDTGLEIGESDDPRSPILAQKLQNALHQSRVQAQKILSQL